MAVTMKTISISLALLVYGSCALADDELPIPADKFVYCTVCHGTQVMGNENIQAPRLSGMRPWYVERQLQAFKKGWRGTHAADLAGMEMQPMAVALSDDEIVEVAKFVSATRSDQPRSSLAGDAQAGQSLYQSCAACHGEDGSGNKALGGPALTSLDDWYLVAQLKNYKNGLRGTYPADTYGVQMAAATQLLADDKAVQNVVKYITTLATD